MLDALTRVAEWVWITGNHDEGLGGKLRGCVVSEIEVSGVTMRHEAGAGEQGPEISGHFHPKLRLRVRERHIVRPCAVVAQGTSDGSGRMILPAFGAYTGGMDAGDPAIRAALQPAQTITAVLPAKDRLVQFPLWRAAA